MEGKKGRVFLRGGGGGGFQTIYYRILQQAENLFKR